MPAISLDIPDELLPGLDELAQNAKIGRVDYLRYMILRHFDYLERVRVADEGIAKRTAGHNDQL